MDNSTHEKAAGLVPAAVAERFHISSVEKIRVPEIFVNPAEKGNIVREWPEPIEVDAGWWIHSQPEAKELTWQALLACRQLTQVLNRLLPGLRRARWMEKALLLRRRRLCCQTEQALANLRTALGQISELVHSKTDEKGGVE